MTNLDELKAKWEEHDRLLEQSLRLNRELLTATKLTRISHHGYDRAGL